MVTEALTSPLIQRNESLSQAIFSAIGCLICLCSRKTDMGPQNCHLPSFHGSNCPSSASDPQPPQFHKSRSTLPDQHSLARVCF